MPSLLTIDTLVHLTTTHLLHPFVFLLLGLTYAASTFATPSTIFASDVLHLDLRIPNFPTVCVAISIIFFSLRLLAALDHKIAVGTRRKLNWEDEVVLITGGLGGLGGLIAEVYGIRGIPVAVVDIRELKRDEEEELSSKGISYWQCDVGNRDLVQRTLKAVEKELGPPTILINNAAMVCGKAFLDLSSNELERLYHTNVLAHYHTVQQLLPNMLARPHGGSIVTISSVLGYTGCAGLSAYTSSKAALTALHHSLTAELALLAQQQGNRAGDQGMCSPRNVKTLLVTPGQLSTPLFEDVAPPSTFIGPVVPVNELAAEIVKRIDAGEGGELSMPLYARWIGLLGVLPAGVGSLTRRIAGLDTAGWKAFGKRSATVTT